MSAGEVRCDARIVDQVVKEPGIYFQLGAVGSVRSDMRFIGEPLPLWGRGSLVL